jgi:hypothetical protein
MISLTAQQPFSLILFKRKPYGHRLYVKEDPYYRYTKLFFTRLGLASFGMAVLVGVFFMAITFYLF